MYLYSNLAPNKEVSTGKHVSQNVALLLQQRTSAVVSFNSFNYYLFQR